MNHATTATDISQPQAEDVGFLVGAACGAVLGLVFVAAAAFYVVRRQRTATPVAAAPCPRCGGAMSKPVGYTWWGGLVGPKLLHHVECERCGTAFNGRTGRPNTLGIAIYLGSTVVIALVVVGAAASFFFS